VVTEPYSAPVDIPEAPGYEVGARGLRRALLRLSRVPGANGVTTLDNLDFTTLWMPIAEALWWISALDEWHMRRFCRPKGPGKKAVVSAADYRVARAGLKWRYHNSGGVVGALTWLRNVTGHGLVIAAHVRTYQPPLFWSLPTGDTWTLGDAPLIPSLEDYPADAVRVYVAWRSRRDLDQALPRPSPADGRELLYESLVEGHPPLPTLRVAYDYLTTEDQAWSLTPQ